MADLTCCSRGSAGADGRFPDLRRRALRAPARLPAARQFSLAQVRATRRLTPLTQRMNTSHYAYSAILAYLSTIVVYGRRRDAALWRAQARPPG